MSKGGGGSSSGNTTTQQAQTNPLAQAAYTNAVNTGTAVAGQNYPVYNSPLVAGFTPQQQAGFANVNQAAGLAQPYIGQAANLIQQSTAGINPASTVDQYMSPYTQNVVQGLQAVQGQQNAQQQEQLVGQASAAGAFGGDRSQIAQSMLAGQQALGENPAISQALQAGYGQALSTGLSSQEANAWLASQGAFGLANLGQEAQGQALSGANAQIQSGTLQQQLAQQELNVPYQQFQQAQAFPYQISNFEMGLATGANGAGGSSSTTTPAPSLLSQGIGLGAVGLGAYNAYRNSGLGSGGSYSGNPAYVGGAEKSLTAGNYSTPSGAGDGFYVTQRGGRIPPEGRALGGYVGGGYIAPMAAGGYAGAGLGASGAYGDSTGIGAPLGVGTPPQPQGALSPLMQAGLGAGNPAVGGSAQQIRQMPTEKLHELAARFPPNSQQGSMVQAILRQRQMNPQSDPGMQPQGLGAMPGMAAGGGLHGYATDGGVDPGDGVDDGDDFYESIGGGAAHPAPDPSLLDLGQNATVPGLGASPSYSDASGHEGLGLGSSAPSGSFGAGPSVAPTGRSGAGGLGAPMPSGPAVSGGGRPGYLDVVAGAESSNGRDRVGHMTSSGEEQGLYQITTGTWKDFAPKAGIDLTRFPTASSAPDSVQSAVANVIPISRWGPRTLNILKASYPDADISKPLGSLAGSDAASGQPPTAGLGQSPSMIAMNDSADAPQGLGATPNQPGKPSFFDNLTTGGNGALIAAGLGMLGGTSPNAAVNIGQGGLKGLGYAEDQRKLAAQVAETQARIKQTGDYQTGELALRALGLSQQAAQQAAQNAMHADEMNATSSYRAQELALRQQQLEQGHYQYQPWQQPDPDKPGGMITGMMRTSTKSDEPPQFIPAAGMAVNKADPTSAAFNTTGAAATGVSGDEYLKTLPPAIGTQVKALADGRMQFPTGFALKSPYWQNMLSAVSQYDPNFDAINYNSRAKTRADFTSGASSKVAGALNTVMPHLELLDKSFDALGNGQFPWVNAAKNWAAEKGLAGSDASAAPTNAREAVSAVASEMRKVFAASGGGNLTELESWEKNFPVNGTPEQQKGAIQQAFGLMDSRLSSLGDTYYRGMGRTEEPTNFLSPTAQAAYQRLTGHAPQSAPAGRNQTGTLSQPDGQQQQAPMQPPAGHPDARWSGKYGQWLVPGPGTNQWVPVQ